MTKHFLVEIDAETAYDAVQDGQVFGDLKASVRLLVPTALPVPDLGIAEVNLRGVVESARPEGALASCLKDLDEHQFPTTGSLSARVEMLD